MTEFTTRQSTEIALTELKKRYPDRIFNDDQFFNLFANELGWVENWLVMMEKDMSGGWNGRKAEEVYRAIKQRLDEEFSILSSTIRNDTK